MFAITVILSCIIKIRGLFKSTKWRHFENVKFKALSARRDIDRSIRKCLCFQIKSCWAQIQNMLIDEDPLGQAKFVHLLKFTVQNLHEIMMKPEI